MKTVPWPKAWSLGAWAQKGLHRTRLGIETSKQPGIPNINDSQDHLSFFVFLGGVKVELWVMIGSNHGKCSPICEFWIGTQVFCQLTIFDPLGSKGVVASCFSERYFLEGIFWKVFWSDILRGFQFDSLDIRIFLGGFQLGGWNVIASCPHWWSLYLPESQAISGWHNMIQFTPDMCFLTIHCSVWTHRYV